MGELLGPADAEPIPESLHEHLELAHYIDVFRSSAERVRRVVFIIMIFSVMMLVAQWNTTDESWVPRRYRTLAELYASVKNLPEADADKAVFAKTVKRFHSRDELEKSLDAYGQQRVEKIFLVEIPGLGVTFDINDLGNFCGLAYLLLMLILLFSIMREHENLYLALFKVRRLHDHAARKSDGESTANYLYHALAMSQVLSSPPTLAQWKPSGLKRAVLHAIFFAPAFVQGYIIYVNARTVGIAKAYGSSALVMLPEYVLFLVNLTLGIATFFYARSCNGRWKSAFLYVNPSLRYVQQQPWRMWLRFPNAAPRSHVQRHLWNRVVERLHFEEPAADNIASVISSRELSGREISYEDIRELCLDLEALAAEAAKFEYDEFEIISGEVTSSVVEGGVWTVQATFGIRAR